MNILRAAPGHLDVVAFIVHNTITTIYPNYYPAGAVEFFLNHHTREKILASIERGEVYLVKQDGEYVGTGSIKGNEICRLFILPRYQGRGVGTSLMDVLEQEVFCRFDKVEVSASLPAYQMYLNRGYVSLSYHRIQTPNGHYLCYHRMSKAKTP